MNLLTDPVIQTDVEWHSLPGLMAAMVRGEVASFPALRPHQRPAWHMFLVQLAVLALDAEGLRTLPEDETIWRTALRRLTPGFDDDAPWHLVVANESKPAFLQPPDPGGLTWSDVPTPDALDMLMTSRNHDVKREIALRAVPQDWIFALVSLQTMEGYSGRKNHGIARMNGAYSSRVMLTLAPCIRGEGVVDPSAWWRRDVGVLLKDRQDVEGKALLWLEPWPEDQQIDFGTLAPLFIEICRRIRLCARLTGLMAIRSVSAKSRVAATEQHGNTRDPWAPVQKEGAKSWTLRSDWTYEVLFKLLYGGDWTLPRLAQPVGVGEDQWMVLIAEAFVRGEGKTQGFHSRVIWMPKAAVQYGFRPEIRFMAQGQIEDVEAINRALRNALALVAADGDRVKCGPGQYARAQPACKSLQRFADAEFFPALWNQVESNEKGDRDGVTQARQDFVDKLMLQARQEFDRALLSIPCTSIMRPCAEARGRALLKYLLKNQWNRKSEKETVHGDAAE